VKGKKIIQLRGTRISRAGSPGYTTRFCFGVFRREVSSKFPRKAHREALLRCVDSLTRAIRSRVAYNLELISEVSRCPGDEHEMLVPAHQLPLSGSAPNDYALDTASNLKIQGSNLYYIFKWVTKKRNRRTSMGDQPCVRVAAHRSRGLFGRSSGTASWQPP
jgi:hypothetical protein